MKTYDSYKESEIEYVGLIPNHWEVKRIRHVAKIFGRIGYRGYTVSDLVHNGEGAITISPSNMKDSNLDFSECTFLSWEKYEESPEIKIYEDDILFVKTGSTYGKSAIVRQLPKEATINPQIVVFKNISCDNLFLWYSIKAPFIQLQVEETVVGGTIPTISQSKINNYTFPLPPSLQEQSAIASYLDRKTAEIDELIADKKRLLELYEEEKTAVINQAVTKGLDPNSTTKDSGIDWIGEIPEHWGVKRIDRVTNIVRGNTGFKKDELLVSGEYVALQYGKTYKVNEINGSFNFFVNSEFYKSNQIVQFGDVILISTSETIEDLGHSCFYAREEIGLLGGEQILLRPISSSILGKFLYYSSKVFCVQLRKFATGIKVYRFNIDNLKEMYTVIPPIDEQILIVQYIDNEITRLDTKKAKTQKLIDLLTEYRTALISEVVTGKVKVTD